MIITCPHCQTKYQVTYEAIGSVGRKVQCAHCQEAWQQAPIDRQDAATPAMKQAFAIISEDGLDDAMVAEEQRVAAASSRHAPARSSRFDATVRGEGDAGRIDPAVIRRRQRAFSRRQNAIMADQPLARLRRAARVGVALLLCAVVLAAYFGRVEVVQRYPAMAGVYEAIGLGVNVVGLDFSNVSTTATIRDGKEVLIVSAQIVGLMPKPVRVPAVVVTLVDANGRGIYEWSVAPSVPDMMAGERATFDTQLILPPGAAARVRLSFAGGAGIGERSEPAVVPPPATEPDHSSPEHH